MVLFTQASPSDYDERLDFANYVFSQNSEPHDFRAMLPKAYARENAGRVTSFIAKDQSNGRIIGMADVLPQTMTVGGNALILGCVGTVCAHPYRRGEGIMSTLLKNVISDCREKGYDMLCLGGQRQRYAHFGFEPGGTRIAFMLNKKNLQNVSGSESIRFEAVTDPSDNRIDFFLSLQRRNPMHVERTKAEFLLSAQSWNEELFAVYDSDRLIGYVNACIHELALEDDSDILRVILALLCWQGKRGTEFSVGAHETERIALLGSVCEGFSVTTSEMCMMLRRENCIETLLQFKNSYSPLINGSFILGLVGESLEISVKEGRVQVEKTAAAPELSLNELEFQRLLLSPLSSFNSLPSPLNNWLPLPFLLQPADSF